MPNFDHFEYRAGPGAWQRSEKLPLRWTLQPGPNVLRVRAVNRFGVPGPEAVVMLRVKRPFTEPEPFFVPKPKPKPEPKAKGKE